MKAKLEFDLPEDEYAFKVASSAQEMKDAIFNFDEYLRSVEKHRDHNYETSKLIQEIREEFYEALGRWVND